MPIHAVQVEIISTTIEEAVDVLKPITEMLSPVAPDIDVSTNPDTGQKIMIAKFVNDDKEVAQDDN